MIGFGLISLTAVGRAQTAKWADIVGPEIEKCAARSPEQLATIEFEVRLP